MNLRRLEYFVAVARQLHFGRAARDLHMAQPPLSQQIRLLEDDLGLALFDRSTRRVELTRAGEVLLSQAERLLANAESVDRVMEQFRSGESGTLRLGFVDSAAFEVMPRFVREYRQRWPHVQFELSTNSSDLQAQALRAGELDLGIGRTAGDGKAIKARVLTTEPLVVAAPSDHRLAARKSTQLTQLAGESLIGFDRALSPTFHAELAALLTGAGFAYDPEIEASEYTSVLGLVAAGQGVAIVPATVCSFQAPGLSYVRLRDRAATARLLLLRRTDDELPLAQRGWNLATEVFAP